MADTDLGKACDVTRNPRIAYKMERFASISCGMLEQFFMTTKRIKGLFEATTFLHDEVHASV